MAVNAPRVSAIAVGPHEDADVVEAIRDGGAAVAALEYADALIWTGSPADFPSTLPTTVRWVQLPSAGVEQWFATAGSDASIFDTYPEVQFTSAAGAFSDSVAEHAFMFLLAGVRALPQHLICTTWEQQRLMPEVGTLRGSTVAIVGAGGIGRALIAMLTSVGARTIAVNRSGTAVPGATETVSADRLGEVWGRTDHVVVAAPATSDTAHLVGREQLAQLKPHSWVVNIARGSLIDSDALVAAVENKVIAGAGLDVTDPEPLPDGHPLWSMTNVMITPHDSNPSSLRKAAFARHVAANVQRFCAGEPLLAIVDTTKGY